MLQIILCLSDSDWEWLTASSEKNALGSKGLKVSLVLL